MILPAWLLSILKEIVIPLLSPVLKEIVMEVIFPEVEETAHEATSLDAPDSSIYVRN